MTTEDTPAGRFAEVAAHYVRLVDRHREMSLVAFVTQVHPLLVDLYRAALALPAVEPADEDFGDRLSNDDWTSMFQSLGRLFGEHDHYTEAFDPYEAGQETVHPSLADDLADTYRDIRHGLAAWKAGQRDEAVWLWRFGLESHWGRHVTDALRPLHSLMFDYRLLGQEQGGGAA